MINVTCLGLIALLPRLARRRRRRRLGPGGGRNNGLPFKTNLVHGMLKMTRLSTHSFSSSQG